MADIDCKKDGEFYAIEHRRLYDLKTGLVLRAQIVSINSEENTASINILDECTTELNPIPDLTEIPFDYLCDGSGSRTVSALSRGYQAFSVLDIVYVLALSAINTGDPARFYIIGHVDIRDTKKCQSGDYIVIVMGWDTIFSPTEVSNIPTTTYGNSLVTIFDVAAGSTIDIGTFDNLDELSPAKPTSFPCPYNDSFKTWLSYNFSLSVPAHSTNLTIEEYGPNIGTIITNIDTRNDPVCEREHTVVTSGGLEKYFNVSKEGSSIISSGGHTYYENISSEMSLNFSYGSGISGWRFRDGVTSGTFYANFYGTLVASASMSASGGNGAEFSGTAAINWTIYGKSNFCDDNFVKGTNSGSTPWGGQTEAFRVPKFDSGFNSLAEGVVAKGAKGIYVLCNTDDTIKCMNEWTLFEPYDMYSNPIEYFCDLGSPYFCSLPNEWGEEGAVSRSPYIMGIAYGFVCLFEDVGEDLGLSVPGISCLQARDYALSRSLENTFKELKLSIFSHITSSSASETWATTDPYVFKSYSRKISGA